MSRCEKEGAAPLAAGRLTSLGGVLHSGFHLRQARLDLCEHVVVGGRPYAPRPLRAGRISSPLARWSCPMCASYICPKSSSRRSGPSRRHEHRAEKSARGGECVFDHLSGQNVCRRLGFGRHFVFPAADFSRENGSAGSCRDLKISFAAQIGGQRNVDQIGTRTIHCRAEIL